VEVAEKDTLQPITVAPGASKQGGMGLPVDLLLNLALAAVDILALNTAFVAAYFLRYSLQIGGEIPGEFDVSYQDYIPVQAAMTVILLVTFVLKGMYRESRGATLVGEWSSLLSATSTGVMILFAAVSMTRYPASSRALFIYFWLLAIVCVAMARLLHRILTTSLQKRGLGVRRVLVVGGNNALGRRIMHSIATEQSVEAQVIGFVDLEDCDDFGRFRCLGTLKDTPRVVREQHVDEVVIALPAAFHEQMLKILDDCERMDVSFRLVPDLYQMRLNRVDVDTINGIPLIAVSQVRIRGWNLLIKRALDVTTSMLVLTLAAPLIALTALAIKLDSPGPVLFRQTRIGKGGERFSFLKFRSMRQDAEQQLAELMCMNEVSGPIFKIRDDPRMTRVGRVIRRISLDELPQLINVLRGEMSLVGPRPPIHHEVAKYEDWHLRRLEVSPGMTGLWQVSGRSEIPFDEMVMLDIYYIENWSLGLDLKILLRTIPAVLCGGGAF